MFKYLRLALLGAAALSTLTAIVLAPNSLLIWIVLPAGAALWWLGGQLSAEWAYLEGQTDQALSKVRDGLVRATQPLEPDRTFEKAVWITDPDQLIRYARLALLFQDRPDERATALCAWAVKAAGLDPLKHSVAVTNQNARAILVLVYSQDLNTSERERLTRLAVEGPG